MPAVDRNNLVKGCIKDKTKVDFVMLEGLFSQYSKKMQPSATQTLQTIASSIFTKMGATPTESVKQYFKA